MREEVRSEGEISDLNQLSASKPVSRILFPDESGWRSFL